MIELTRAQLDIVNAIFDGAKTAKDITSAVRFSKSRVFRALTDISMLMGIARTRGKPDYTISEILDIGRDCFELAQPRAASALEWEDKTPEEIPGLQWPDYSPHNLVFRP